MGGVNFIGYINHSLILLVLSFFVVMFARKIETKLIRIYGYAVGVILLLVALLSAGLIFVKIKDTSGNSKRNAAVMPMPLPPR